jgi:hypothetical protein
MNTFIVDLIIHKIENEMREDCNLVNRLHRKGYNDNYELSNNLLRCLSNNFYYSLKDFNVDELHNLEGFSSASGGLFLLAIRHRIEGHKGIFVGYLDDNMEMSFYNSI